MQRFGQAVGGFDSYVAGMIGSVPSSQFISQGTLTAQEQEKMKQGLELGLGLEARRLSYELILAKRTKEAQGAVMQTLKHFDPDAHRQLVPRMGGFQGALNRQGQAHHVSPDKAQRKVMKMANTSMAELVSGMSAM